MPLGAEELVFGNLLGHLLAILPTLLVLVVGLILVAVSGKRLPGRARVLAFLGGAVLLLSLFLGLVWGIMVPTLIRDRTFSPADFAPINLVVTLLLSLMQAAGIGLLIGALLSARTAPATASSAAAPTPAPAMPAAPSPAWPGTPTPYPTTTYPTTPAPHPPTAAPPAPPQWTPPTS